MESKKQPHSTGFTILRRSSGFTILRRSSGFTILRRSSGFTIVELLVVIVVIGILAAITIVSYTGMTQKATVASLTSDLDNASRQIKLYQVTSSASSYPTNLDANYCPIPADTARCLKPSPGVTYQYSVDNGTTPQGFCITAIKGTTSYKITNDSAPVPGDCQSYGLAAYYPFDTNANDTSGNNKNGTVYGATLVAGVKGQAYSLNGVDNYISTPTSPVHSIAMWVKPSSNQLTTALPTYYNQSWQTTAVGYWWVYTNTTQTTINWQYAYGTAYSTVSWSNAITYDAWNYFVFVFDNVGKTITLYKNGVSLGTRSCSGALLPSSTIYLGNYQGSATSQYHMNGLFDEVRIYNRVLSADEVNLLYNL